MTSEMVKKWCDEGVAELAEASDSQLSVFKGVQQANQMQENLPVHIYFLQKVASQVYTQWIKGLV